MQPTCRLPRGSLPTLKHGCVECAFFLEIFERRRKYDVSVWMSRHPELNDYICQVLSRSKVMISKGIVRRVVACIFSSSAGQGGTCSPVERVVFEMRNKEDWPWGGEGALQDGDLQVCMTTPAITEKHLPSFLQQRVD
ncbi:unnamed protein product [Discosporangium mesarthrocarpum]